MGDVRACFLLALLVLSAAPGPVASSPAGAPDDRFLAGPATVVVRLRSGVRAVEATVEDGVLRRGAVQPDEHDPRDGALLGAGTDRVNPSYAAVGLVLAYDLGEAIRIHAGGSSLIRERSGDLGPSGVRAGVELRSPARARTRPIAGIAVQAFQETDWDGNLSIQAGVELSDGSLADMRVQLLAEYFTGRSPNGHFRERTVEFAGVGLRVRF